MNLTLLNRYPIHKAKNLKQNKNENATKQSKSHIISKQNLDL